MFTPGQAIRSAARTPEMTEGCRDRARLGSILMSASPSTETDSRHMAPEGFVVRFTRLKTDDHTMNETLSRHIEHMADAAARIQPGGEPGVVRYGCTSGSIVIGGGAPWMQPVCPVRDVMHALHELGAETRDMVFPAVPGSTAVTAPASMMCWAVAVPAG